ncbi:collagen alpha-1(I) chain-like [Trichosurus vulpecula]|uniref:collagen alpha-1(I) chain-like n=1 Tax=Trichosurus vulpecula TaxID=9337 RepID=UPI00186B2672|nr:collagen alpha-1(I) chain-like [Trichosurus vulpecula]
MSLPSPEYGRDRNSPPPAVPSQPLDPGTLLGSRQRRAGTRGRVGTRVPPLSGVGRAPPGHSPGSRGLRSSGGRPGRPGRGVSSLFALRGGCSAGRAGRPRLRARAQARRGGAAAATRPPRPPGPAGLPAPPPRTPRYPDSARAGELANIRAVPGLGSGSGCAPLQAPAPPRPPRGSSPPSPRVPAPRPSPAVTAGVSPPGLRRLGELQGIPPSSGPGGRPRLFPSGKMMGTSAHPSRRAVQPRHQPTCSIQLVLEAQCLSVRSLGVR